MSRLPVIAVSTAVLAALAASGCLRPPVHVARPAATARTPTQSPERRHRFAALALIEGALCVLETSGSVRCVSLLAAPDRPPPAPLVGDRHDVRELLPGRHLFVRHSNGRLSWLAVPGHGTPDFQSDLHGSSAHAWVSDEAYCTRDQTDWLRCTGTLLHSGAAPPAGREVFIHASAPVEDVVFAWRTCLRLADGTVRCFIRGDPVVDGVMPTRPVPDVHDAVALTTSDHASCAILADRTARCWGAGEYGALGDGTAGPHPATATPRGLRDVVRLVAGPGHVCAIVADGRLSCWGLDDEGQLGVAPEDVAACVVGGRSVPCRRSPTEVPLPIAARDVAVGDGRTCVLLDDDTLRCFGAGGLRMINVDGPIATCLDDDLADAGTVRSASWAEPGTAVDVCLGPKDDLFRISCWSLGLIEPTRREPIAVPARLLADDHEVEPSSYQPPSPPPHFCAERDGNAVVMWSCQPPSPRFCAERNGSSVMVCPASGGLCGRSWHRYFSGVENIQTSEGRSPDSSQWWDPECRRLSMPTDVREDFRVIDDGTVLVRMIHPDTGNPERIDGWIETFAVPDGRRLARFEVRDAAYGPLELQPVLLGSTLLAIRCGSRPDCQGRLIDPRTGRTRRVLDIDFRPGIWLHVERDVYLFLDERHAVWVDVATGILLRTTRLPSPGLRPGSARVLLETRSSLVVVQSGSPAEHGGGTVVRIGWTDGRLQFRNAPPRCAVSGTGPVARPGSR